VPYGVSVCNRVGESYSNLVPKETQSRTAMGIQSTQTASTMAMGTQSTQTASATPPGSGAQRLSGGVKAFLLTLLVRVLTGNNL
jgi:hypothetical protein